MDKFSFCEETIVKFNYGLVDKELREVQIMSTEPDKLFSAKSFDKLNEFLFQI